MLLNNEAPSSNVRPITTVYVDLCYIGPPTSTMAVPEIQMGPGGGG